MMNVKNMEVGLSPPYGDGIETVDTWQPDNMFSPPYGDGMIEQAEHEIQGTFSPPYGIVPKRGTTATRLFCYRSLTG